MRECFSRLQKMILTEAYKNKGSVIIDDVYQKYFGKIEVHPGFPKRIPISPLNVHLSPWETIEIKYHHRLDSNTGKLYPRVAKWFGIKKRSSKELQELEADYTKTLKKHRLIPEIIRPELALDADLMKE
jgi:hypothetical protein